MHKTMLLSRSSNLIKAWLTRGQHYHKVQGDFYQKGSGHEILSGGRERGDLNMIRFHSTLADFNVTRSEPELVRPSCPTPNKLMPLSDIDKLDVLRFQMPLVLFYPVAPNMKHKDPAKFIRNALAEALVYYYPWAGRMFEQPTTQNLVVDCKAEGAVFAEADLDISLQDLGKQPLVPPFPYLDKLLYGGVDYSSEVDYSVGLLDSPMLTFQVTRMSCGGFILALKFNHAMTDGGGITQFLTAITEFARGASAPSIHPVWYRDLLNPPHPCHVTPNKPAIPITIPNNLVRRTVIFNPSDIATLRGRIPEHLRPTTFEVIAAALWRSRAIALEFEPREEVRLAFAFDARTAFEPPIPAGYYGNAFTFATATSPAAKIYDDSTLSYTVEQVKKAKGTTMEEYKKSLIAPGILRGLQLPLISPSRTCILSDISRFGFLNLDFGWGKPVYGGPANNTHFYSRSFSGETPWKFFNFPVFLLFTTSS